MRSSTFTFNAQDGHALFVYRWEPDEGVPVNDGGSARTSRATPPNPPVKAVVHIAHGMAEHAARYERLAQALTGRGYAVYANDHRGHGKTAQDESDLGFFASSGGWARVVADISELIAREKTDHPGAPVVLLGHSMGSYMAQTFLFEHPDAVRAAILSGSSGRPTPIASAGRYVARLERKRLGERGKSPILKSLSFDAFNKAFRPNRTAFDWLSRDPVEVDKYAADDRCGFACSAALWIDVLDALAENARPTNLARIRKDLPVYIIAGTEDPVGERTVGVKRLLDAYRSAGLYRVTHRFYASARHELFNETNRDEVTADLAGWLDKNVA